VALNLAGVMVEIPRALLGWIDMACITITWLEVNLFNDTQFHRFSHRVCFLTMK
jgi:hypothetical protein